MAHDPKWKDAVMAGFAHTRDDGAFGVPLFIYRGERFWGNDRLDWLLREVARSEGREPSGSGGGSAGAGLLGVSAARPSRAGALMLA